MKRWPDLRVTLNRKGAKEEKTAKGKENKRVLVPIAAHFRKQSLRSLLPLRLCGSIHLTQVGFNWGCGPAEAVLCLRP